MSAGGCSGTTTGGGGSGGATGVSVSPRYGPIAFPGLAAGASATRTYTTDCVNETRQAVADALGQVSETDETNNTRSDDIVCIA